MATVLVVDDDAQIARSIHRVLHDHEVSIAMTGLLAIAKIDAGERFDVIFCDVNMPGMTGLEFRDEVSLVDQEQAKRIVFLTGAAFDCAPNRCLTKPFSNDELKATVSGSSPILRVARTST
jgi:CheY-like chemotaxis protein